MQRSFIIYSKWFLKLVSNFFYRNLLFYYFWYIANFVFNDSIGLFQIKEDSLGEKLDYDTLSLKINISQKYIKKTFTWQTIFLKR